MNKWLSDKETKAERADRILAGLRHMSKRDDKRTYSHEEIADVCGVAPVSILEIEAKALKRLHFILKDGVS